MDKQIEEADQNTEGDDSSSIPKRTKPGSQHRRLLKEEFLKVYQENPAKTVEEAAEAIGPDDVSYTARRIWGWANDDHTFKRDIESAQARKLQWMHDTTLSRTFKKIKSGDSRVRENTNFLKYLDRLQEKQATDKEQIIDADAVDQVGERLLRVFLLQKGAPIEDDEDVQEVIEEISDQESLPSSD